MEYLGRDHFLYGARGSKGEKIVAVKQKLDPVTKAFQALIVNEYGLYATSFAGESVLGKGVLLDEMPSDLGLKLLTYLIGHASSAFDRKLAGFSSTFYSDEDNLSWSIVSKPASFRRLSLGLLELDVLFAVPKRFCVNVICNVDGESEKVALENMANDGSDPSFQRLLNILGSVQTRRGWGFFAGNTEGDEDVSFIRYTSWRGYEIVFHVASSLNHEQQRRYLPENRAAVVFTKGGNSRAIKPEFSSPKNSVATVVQWLNAKEAGKYSSDLHQGGRAYVWSEGGWRIATFSRRNLETFQSHGLSRDVFTNDSILRDTILSNLVNAHIASFRFQLREEGVYQRALRRLIGEGLGE
jgi:hypothetical protein